jgi:tRNA A-37 threonylcarbamoyl transferase component Bud32
MQKLASGGMADVYLATRGNRDFVIKKLRSDHIDNISFQRMFELEADLALSLRHPNIVKAIETGVYEGQHYLVMERLLGCDLRTIVRSKRTLGRTISASLSVRIIADLLEALEYAHSARDRNGARMNLVHRDVSPQNLFVTSVGRGVLIDFGVARISTRPSETEHGTLKGKVSYMAPEQLRHEAFDLRADLYATGVMLYELLLNRKPYPVQEHGDFAVMLAISQGKIVPPLSVDPSLSKGLVDVLSRALATKPENRFASAGEFHEALARASMALGALASNAQIAELVPSEVATEVDTFTPVDGAADGLIGGEIRGFEIRGDINVVTLGDRISEAFKGAALAKFLSSDLLIDAGRVRRVTSFGVREWLLFLEACKPSCSLSMLRCPPALARQTGMVRGFLENVHIVSILMPLLCRDCGNAQDLLVNLEKEGALYESVLARKRTPDADCKRCGSACFLDEVPETFDFVQHSIGVRVPEAVRNAVLILEEEAKAPEILVEKWVTAAGTSVRIKTGAMPPRWKTILDGVEGKLAIEIVDEDTNVDVKALVAVLRRTPGLTEVSLSGCTGEDALEFLRDAEGDARSVVRIAKTLDCIRCGETSIFETRVAMAPKGRKQRAYGLEDLPPLFCSSCGTQAPRGRTDTDDTALVDIDVVDTTESAALETAAAASVHTKTAWYARVSPLWIVGMMLVLGLVIVIVGIAGSNSRSRVLDQARDSAVPLMPSSNSATWRVLESLGQGDTEVAALRDARTKALLHLATELESSLRYENGTAPPKGVRASDDEIIARIDRVLGSTLERTGVNIEHSASARVACLVNYRVTETELAKLRAEYSACRSFGGLVLCQGPPFDVPVSAWVATSTLKGIHPADRVTAFDGVQGPAFSVIAQARANVPHRITVRTPSGALFSDTLPAAAVP